MKPGRPLKPRVLIRLDGITFTVPWVKPLLMEKNHYDRYEKLLNGIGYEFYTAKRFNNKWCDYGDKLFVSHDARSTMITCHGRFFDQKDAYIKKLKPLFKYLKKEFGEVRMSRIDIAIDFLDVKNVNSYFHNFSIVDKSEEVWEKTYGKLGGDIESRYITHPRIYDIVFYNKLAELRKSKKRIEFYNNEPLYRIRKRKTFYRFEVRLLRSTLRKYSGKDLVDHLNEEEFIQQILNDFFNKKKLINKKTGKDYKSFLNRIIKKGL